MAKNKHLSPLEDTLTDSSSEAVESEEDEEHVEVGEEEKEVEASEEDEPEVQQEQPKKASSTPEVKKNRSKPANSTAPAFVAAATPPTKSSQKRSVVENGGGEGNVSKKAKTENKKKKKKVLETDGGEEAAAEIVEKEAAAMTGERSSFFRRLWSEDDEIVILNGIVDFMEKRGPAADIHAYAEAFHKFIKQSLHVDTTNGKLLDKIRKMKSKYMRNVKKSEKKSVGKLFRNPHDIEIFHLSKKIWGVEEANRGGGPKEDGGQNAGPLQILVSNNFLNELSFMKDGLNLINIATRPELEKDWKNLLIEEAEIYLKRIELAGKQTKLVLDAFKKF